MQPEFDDEEAINPFDFWEGANFKLKIVKKEGYWNYDNSEFANPSPLLDGDDDALEAIWKKEHSLSALVASDQFKSYDQLEKRLNQVLGIGSSSNKAKSFDDSEYESYTSQKSKDESIMEELEESYRKSKSVPDVPEDIRQELNKLSSNSVDDEEDPLDYFQKLIDD
jgi:hypothetical protein